MEGIFDTRDNDTEQFADEPAVEAGAQAAAGGEDSYETEVLDPVTPAEERLFSSRPSRPLGDGCWMSVPIYAE